MNEGVLAGSDARTDIYKEAYVQSQDSVYKVSNSDTKKGGGNQPTIHGKFCQKNRVQPGYNDVDKVLIHGCQKTEKHKGIID
ncbi:uncharacterized protein EAF02_003831 [Botrytis sinoallii]|uniref:uncharacterized protein n=1 Tax=Botrytis sinoallii TaxID=1463999 RepID=UPI0019015E66|nr:uncharacterized protein EAF02_003831 [Botrytis sinoallii]KAF7887184.1 hypothetical protein EAF02_003831 [Botrytis sinoallii]